MKPPLSHRLVVNGDIVSKDRLQSAQLGHGAAEGNENKGEDDFMKILRR